MEGQGVSDCLCLSQFVKFLHFLREHDQGDWLAKGSAVGFG